MQLSKYKADEVIKATKGKIFSCSFIKKDGTVRNMVARIGVHKNLAGGKNGASERNSLVTVFDMLNGGYRMINLETLITLKVSGNSYQVL
ncbi:SH3 beta-barrel fold-containing protein [Aliarcobacter butzleri]|uniref:SH3 beta-barrel fold-containing protein n=1 Tax=Aliarcobacter butzleri TaxID=28197 RepID=UPI003AF3CF67